jgi:hypothetical protein
MQEETDKCTVWSWRGTDPSTFTQTAEISSGRSILQQGLVATCTDREKEGNQSRSEEFGLTHEPVRALKVG